MSDPTAAETLSSLSKEQCLAAERTVARNARDNAWTATEIVQVAEALGLRDYRSGGRYGSDGHRLAGRKLRTALAAERHEESA